MDGTAARGSLEGCGPQAGRRPGVRGEQTGCGVPNHLQRQFAATQPKQSKVTDITLSCGPFLPHEETSRASLEAASLECRCGASASPLRHTEIGPLGDVPPAAFETNYHRLLEKQAISEVS